MQNNTFHAFWKQQKELAEETFNRKGYQKKNEYYNSSIFIICKNHNSIQVHASIEIDSITILKSKV